MDFVKQVVLLFKTLKKTNQKMLILTDALSVLQALAEKQTSYPLSIKKLLRNELSRAKEVALHCILEPCGIQGNERTCMLAKQKAKPHQPNDSITYKEKITLVKFESEISKRCSPLSSTRQKGRGRTF